MADYITTYEFKGQRYDFLTKKGCPRKFSVISEIRCGEQILLGSHNARKQAEVQLRKLLDMNPSYNDISLGNECANFFIGERVNQVVATTENINNLPNVLPKGEVTQYTVEDFSEIEKKVAEAYTSFKQNPEIL